MLAQVMGAWSDVARLATVPASLCARSLCLCRSVSLFISFWLSLCLAPSERVNAVAHNLGRHCARGRGISSQPGTFTSEYLSMLNYFGVDEPLKTVS